MAPEYIESSAMHAHQARLSPPGSPAVRVARQWWLFALHIQREGRQTARGQIGPLSSFVAPGGWLFSLPVHVLSGFFQEKDDESSTPEVPASPPVHHPSRVAHKALCQPRSCLFPVYTSKRRTTNGPRAVHRPCQGCPRSPPESSAVLARVLRRHREGRAPVRVHHHSLFARACHRGRR